MAARTKTPKKATKATARPRKATATRRARKLPLAKLAVPGPETAIGVLEARFPDGTPCAVLYTERTLWTMCPIFADPPEARAFLAHVRAKYGVDDPRTIGTAPLDDEFLKFVSVYRSRT